MIYLQGWIQSFELLLFIWFIVWGVSKILDFCRAGMERVRRLEERERASEKEGER
jgi:hypothetical protein